MSGRCAPPTRTAPTRASACVVTNVGAERAGAFAGPAPPRGARRPLRPRPGRLLDRPADPLGRYGPARPQPLGEVADAQLLDHPRHLLEPGRQQPAGGPLLHPAAIEPLELVDGAHAIEVAGGVVGQPLEAPRGPAQVTLDVRQPC